MPRGEEEEIVERRELLLFFFVAPVDARVFLVCPTLFPSLFRAQSYNEPSGGSR
jgi:hypothetical protein